MITSIKKYGCYGVVVLLTLAITSCKKNFLDVTPKGLVSDETVWISEGNADIFLNDIYNNIFDLNVDPQQLEQKTDNDMLAAGWFEGLTIVSAGAIAPNNMPQHPGNSRWGWGGAIWDWANNYLLIRKCNLFIQKVNQNAANFSDDWKKKRLGEAHFLRAYYYHYLLLSYGGVPLITEPLSNAKQGDSIYYPRSSFDETLQFIVGDLDAAATDLEATIYGQGSPNQGRATKGAALTLKAWCQLYAASPLWNPGNDVQKWTTAAASYKQVMDMGVYSLFPDYSSMWLVDNNDNQEVIFNKEYKAITKGGFREGQLGPTIVHGSEQAWGGMVPTQELVDEYAMANGKPITDPASGYDPQNPYKNREQRFYQTIIYDGSGWQGDTIYTRVGGNNEIDLGSTSDIGNTGYYSRHTIDERINGQDNLALQNGGENYIFFRYADVLLCYAEAQNEAVGPDASVYDAISQVRTRSALPGLPVGLSQDEMRTAIRRERRVEFAFEDKRWWDVLRWKIADGPNGVLNNPIHGMLIQKVSGVLTYSKVKVLDKLFYSNNYLLPIPQYAIDQNKKLTQNPGY